MNYYVLDENKNLVEAFDKQGVLAAIEQAIEDGSLENLVADAAFVDKLRCCVSGQTYKMAFVTQQKLNELIATGTTQTNTWYFVIDDTEADDLNAKLEDLNNTIATYDNEITLLNTNRVYGNRIYEASDIKTDGLTEFSFPLTMGETYKKGYFKVVVRQDTELVEELVGSILYSFEIPISEAIINKAYLSQIYAGASNYGINVVFLYDQINTKYKITCETTDTTKTATIISIDYLGM